VFLFGEHIRTGAAALAGEALALAVVIAAAAVLSRSCHLVGENSHPSYLAKPPVNSAANSPLRAGCRRAGRAGGAGPARSGVRRPAARVTGGR
jgi:hypothetical protein